MRKGSAHKLSSLHAGQVSTVPPKSRLSNGEQGGQEGWCHPVMAGWDLELVESNGRAGDSGS